jgi:hypothetical protein
MVELKKESLWLLLQWHALQEKFKVLEEDKSSLFVEMTCFKIGKAGCPNLWYYLEEVVLTMEKANGGEDIGHTYIPSLALPIKSVAPMWRSFTRKEYGKNSIEALLDIQNLEIVINFFFVLGTQRTLVKEKWALELRREVEPIVWGMKWEIAQVGGNMMRSAVIQ